MKLSIYIDGASRGNPGPASVGVVLQDASGRPVKEYHRYIGETTNNVAEYTAMLDALRLAGEMKADEITVHSDSQLLVRQLSGEYRVKNERLFKYMLQIRNLRKQFKTVEVVHISREQNKRADRLANDALDAVKKSPVFRPGKLDGAAPDVIRRFEVSRELLK
ncbi:MAG: ribonuclease HI family protein [Elusimicrobiota bacterium]